MIIRYFCSPIAQKKIEPLRGFKSLPVWLSPEQAMKIMECLAIALLRAQSLILDKPDGSTAATTVVEHAHSAGIEVEAPRVVGVFGRRRPIVAAGPHVVDTSVAMAVARGGQHNTVTVRPSNLTSTAVPLPFALRFQFFELLFTGQTATKTAYCLIVCEESVLIHVFPKCSARQT